MAAIVVTVLIMHYSSVGPLNSLVFDIAQTDNATDFSQIFSYVGVWAKHSVSSWYSGQLVNTENGNLQWLHL